MESLFYLWYLSVQDTYLSMILCCHWYSYVSDASMFMILLSTIIDCLSIWYFLSLIFYLSKDTLLSSFLLGSYFYCFEANGWAIIRSLRIQVDIYGKGPYKGFTWGIFIENCGDNLVNFWVTKFLKTKKCTSLSTLIKIIAENVGK